MLELLPGAVLAFGAFEGVEAGRLDAVDELARLAVGGDEIVPAAGDEAVAGEAEDALGNGVAVVMVVEEPAVEVLVAKGFLDVFEFHLLYPSPPLYFGSKIFNRLGLGTS